MPAAAAAAAAAADESRVEEASEGDGRRMTMDEFAAWKSRKDAEQAEITAAAAAQRAADIAAGKVRMTGRELHQHCPWVFDDNNIPQSE
eukprot:jgi/Chlat1/1273/Chrsp117S01700